MKDGISALQTAVVSGDEIRTCMVRRALADGGWSDPEIHTDLRGAPIGDKVLVWEYDRRARAPGARGHVREHVKLMYCAEGWHSTGGTAEVPDDPQLCHTIVSSRWRKRRPGEERFQPFWEYHLQHPVVWLIQISGQRGVGHRRLAYCDPELPAQYRPSELTGEQAELATRLPQKARLAGGR